MFDIYLSGNSERHFSKIAVYFRWIVLHILRVFFLWQENMATRVIIIEVDDLIAEMLLRTTERKKKLKNTLLFF